VNAPRLKRPVAWGLAAIVAGATLAACGSSGGSTPAAAPAPSGGGELAGVCPSTIVFQADWEPEAEHGGIYAMIGKNYTVDTQQKSVTGPLMDGNTPTGVNLQVRIGGASVGYQDPSALMYTDKSITLGYSRIGDTIPEEGKTPVTAILASMNTSPYAIYWDPKTYPTVKTIADLKSVDAKILTQGETSTWINYLVGTGVVKSSQLDNSTDNKPATFVAAGGKEAEVGFLTAEPYMYQYEISAFGRPVKGQLIADTGYPEYFQSIIARTADVTKMAPCFKKLVPVMQRALAHYIDDPAQTNALLVTLVSDYNDSWQYNAGAAKYAHDTGVKLGILDNGYQGAVGNMDPARVQKLLDLALKYSQVPVDPKLTTGQLFTDQFIDPTIHATTANSK
jgi:hypothetical protein